MDSFIHNYTVRMEKEIEQEKVNIFDMEMNFQSTVWTDEKSMIQSAGDIWSRRTGLKGIIEQHKFILENYRAGE